MALVERCQEIAVKKRAITMLLVVVLGLYGAGCDDTMEGVEEDTEEGVEQIEEETNEEEGS